MSHIKWVTKKPNRMFIEIQSDQCLVVRKNSLGPWIFGRNFRNVITATVTRSSLDFLFMKKMHKVRHHVINFWKSWIFKKNLIFLPVFRRCFYRGREEFFTENDEELGGIYQNRKYQWMGRFSKDWARFPCQWIIWTLGELHCISQTDFWNIHPIDDKYSTNFEWGVRESVFWR